MLNSISNTHFQSGVSAERTQTNRLDSLNNILPSKAPRSLLNKCYGAMCLAPAFGCAFLLAAAVSGSVPALAMYLDSNSDNMRNTVKNIFAGYLITSGIVGGIFGASVGASDNEPMKLEHAGLLIAPSYLAAGVLAYNNNY